MRSLLLHIYRLLRSSNVFFLAVFLLVVPALSIAQHPDTTILINQKTDIVTIRKFAAGLVPENYNVSTGYDTNILSREPLLIANVATADVSKKILTRFLVINNSDEPDSLYFFPGFFFQNVLLYKVENDKVFPLPSIAPPNNYISFRLFPVLPHDTITILAECHPLRTYSSAFRPRLIKPGHLEVFILKSQTIKKNITLFTYIFCGLLLMMILFSIANYVQGRNKEFLYYAGYAFFLGAMLFTKQFYYYRADKINFFFESYMDFILQGLGIWFFILFMIRFLETKKNFPFFT